MILLLARQPTRDGTTLGMLYVDGVRQCETLEDAVRLDGKRWGETAIPFGRYRLIITRSQRFQQMLPLVLDVPNFTGIRIHSGNTAKDTEGCILVGQYHTGAVLEKSRAALDALMATLAPTIANGEDVWLHIEPASPFRQAAQV